MVVNENFLDILIFTFDYNLLVFMSLHLSF